MKTVTHPACGQSWPNANRNSHCSVCCRTFGNHRIGDAHRQTIEGVRQCVDPSTLLIGGWAPKLRGSIWVSGKPDLRAFSRPATSAVPTGI